MTMRAAIVPIVVALVGSGCGYRPARFADRPPVTDLGDRRPIPPPERRPFVESAYLTDVYLRRPLVIALEAKRLPYALDVNALDEVPRSSFWEPLPSEAAAFSRAYAVDGPPVAPVSAAGDGNRIRDARGKEYALAVDPQGQPGTRTAASAIASRLLRAIGYLTPEVWLVPRAELGPVAPEGGAGDWVAAVRWPLGVEIGSTEMSGTGAGDPNDRIPHRDRRTLRALGLAAQWIELPDLGPSRVVDVYVGEAGRGHVRHFVIGLDDSFGVASFTVSAPRETAAGVVRGGAFENLVTLGLLRPAPAKPPANPTLALLALEPDLKFSLGHPWEPGDRLTAPDRYWMARRLMQISSGLLRLAVAEAKLEPPVAEHVVTALESRRRKLASAWMREVTPLQPRSLQNDLLAFGDEAIAHGFAGEGETRYRVELIDDEGDAITHPFFARPRAGKLELDLPGAALVRNYFVVRVLAYRGGGSAPRAFEAHFATAGSARIVGVRH
jgi:hypothetical protein